MKKTAKRTIALFLTALLCAALPACADVPPDSAGSALPEETDPPLPAESAGGTETPETEAPQKTGPLRVLFIGNSHTFFNDMPLLFAGIAAADGREITVESVTKGGWTLEKHANKNDECGKQIDRLLREERFDFVILQENS
ncbi:MAG: hypothetical protein II192_02145, partial [Clostridia bacterium]|nr:hypothetical protein [Clostridia bacterium]